MFNNRTFELVQVLPISWTTCWSAAGVALMSLRMRWLQIHFHTAAEHTFNGTRADLEAHIVHKDPVTSEPSIICILEAVQYEIALPHRWGVLQTGLPCLAFSLRRTGVLLTHC